MGAKRTAVRYDELWRRYDSPAYLRVFRALTAGSMGDRVSLQAGVVF